MVKNDLEIRSEYLMRFHKELKVKVPEISSLENFNGFNELWMTNYLPSSSEGTPWVLNILSILEKKKERYSSLKTNLLYIPNVTYLGISTKKPTQKVIKDLFTGEIDKKDVIIRYSPDYERLEHLAMLLNDDSLFLTLTVHFPRKSDIATIRNSLENSVKVASH